MLIGLPRLHGVGIDVLSLDSQEWLGIASAEGVDSPEIMEYPDDVKWHM